MKKNSPLIDFRAVLAATLDFACLEISLAAGYWLWVAYPWHGNFQPFSAFALLFFILPPLGIVVFKIVGLYKPEMGVLGVEEQSLIFKAIWILYFIGFAVSFFYRQVAFSRLATFYSIFISLFLISTERFLLRHFFQWLNKNNIGVRRALIYGAGYYGQRLERWIRQSPKLGIQVTGYLDDTLEQLTKKPAAPPYLGGLGDLKKVASKIDVSLLFIAHRKLDEKMVIQIFQRCKELGIQCWVIPSLYQFHIERAQLYNIGGIPLVGFRESFSRRSYEWIKGGLDRILTAVLLVATLPLMIAIAALITLTSGTPIFFTQIRVGKNAKTFRMIKFRTLKPTVKAHMISPELDKSAQEKASLLTRFLRRSGFDELPQLWNVLRGEMSIVGPRPEMPFLVKKYGPLERERLTVKPGITGLWQISEDRKRLLIHENMDYDLYYVENFGFNLDLAILLKTIFTVLKRLSTQS